MGNLVQWPIKESDGNGLPLAGGKLYSYYANTDTPKPLYTDAACTVEETNPLVLDADGRAVDGGGAATGYMTTGAYKLVLKDKDGNLIWQIDSITTTGATIDMGAVDSIASLRALTEAQYTAVYLAGYYAGSNTGAGWFTWDSTSTENDDDGVIIGDYNNGRWIRVLDGYVTAYMFGAIGDGATDDHDSIVSANVYAYANNIKLVFSEGEYSIQSDSSLDADYEFLPGAKINIATDKTIIMLGRQIGDPTWQTYSGNGDVTISESKATHIRPEQFGAEVGTNSTNLTNNTAAIQKACNAYSKIKIDNYIRINAAITLDSNKNIFGNGTIEQTAGYDIFTLLTGTMASHKSGIKISGMNFIGNTNPIAYHVFNGNWVDDVEMNDCHCQNIMLHRQEQSDESHGTVDVTKLAKNIRIIDCTQKDTYDNDGNKTSVRILYGQDITIANLQVYGNSVSLGTAGITVYGGNPDTNKAYSNARKCRNISVIGGVFNKCASSVNITMCDGATVTGCESIDCLEPYWVGSSFNTLVSGCTSITSVDTSGTVTGLQTQGVCKNVVFDGCVVKSNSESKCLFVGYEYASLENKNIRFLNCIFESAIAQQSSIYNAGEIEIDNCQFLNIGLSLFGPYNMAKITNNTIRHSIAPKETTFAWRIDGPGAMTGYEADKAHLEIRGNRFYDLGGVCDGAREIIMYRGAVDTNYYIDENRFYTENTSWHNIQFAGSIEIEAAGTGYTALDVLTLAAPVGGTAATVRVDTVNGSGAILTCTLLTQGAGYTADTYASASGGTGSDAEFYIVAHNFYFRNNFFAGAVSLSGAIINVKQWHNNLNIDGSEHAGVGDGETWIFEDVQIEQQIVGTGANFLDIKMNSSDGSDDKAIRIGGGGDVTASRGGTIEIYGNEVAGHTGSIEFIAGVGGVVKSNSTILSSVGDAVPAVAFRIGKTTSEGYEIQVIEETVVINPAAAYKSLSSSIPANSIVLGSQANLETAITGAGGGIKVGIGTSGDPSAWGLSPDLLKNSKINFFPADWAVLPTSNLPRVSAADNIGAAAGTIAGTVRVRIVYATFNSLDDAA